MEPTIGYPIPSLLQSGLNIVVFFFPLMLYAVWATLAFADLGRRADLSPGARLGWGVIVLALPWVGAALYHALGRSGVPGAVRGVLIGGGVTVYVALLLLGRLVGGIS
ncbi:MAG: PLDc N-terminal domain-containing protein [Gemmatimonadetes bacterium]|nr:PLDc N-terminal domain-containing protein [Gemmatimonadota bacterium]